MYTFVVLVLCCIVVISFAIPIEQLDKVVSHNPFDYFTDLDAEDVWFSQTTQDEFANGWIHEPDANVITRLERMSKWHSIVCFMSNMCFYLYLCNCFVYVFESHVKSSFLTFL